MSRMNKSRIFDRAFKVKAVQRMLKGESVSALARELRLRRKLLYQWKEGYQQGGEALLRARGRPKKTESPPPKFEKNELEKARQRIAELERKVGQQALELDFLATALPRVEQVETLARRSTRSLARRRSKAD